MGLEHMKHTVLHAVVRQFGRPTGAGGRVAGWIMAHRSSNVRRNEWAVELPDLAPDAHVLEIGFGPGVAIAALARAVPKGRVYGVDHSPVMLRHARRRNAAAVRSGLVHLEVAPVELVPPFDAPLDAILAVNTVGFWPEPVERLTELRVRLRSRGRIAVVAQPRCPGATEATTRAAARETTAQLERAGYVGMQVDTLELRPAAVCVIAIAP
jgi:SAM-dependent methyltransferase